MGLTSSLQIGRSALTASQIALQVTGNNLANVATPGYSRQVATLAPMRDARAGGLFLGRGVTVLDVNRQIDIALQTRLWSGISQQAASRTDLELLSSVEATLNELSDSDLSSELSAFFGSWSELANSPAATGARSLVIQKGAALTAFIRQMRADLESTRAQIDRQLDASVARADQLLSEIAGLNAAIVTAEGGAGTANGLRDQRDALISELSEILDVSTVQRDGGAVDVLVGSTPVVLAGRSRGLTLERRAGAGGTEVSIRLRESPQDVSVTSGRIGSLLGQRGTLVDDTIERLDAVASQLIFQVNRLHSTGFSSAPLTSVTGTRVLPGGDAARALNDPANATFAGLPFQAANGGFLVTVTDQTTGAAQTVRIDVDLDGIDDNGNPGYGDDSSVQSIAAALNAVPNLTATVNANGTISISAASGYSFGFSEDTSGALAVLGINTFFTGATGEDIGVRAELRAAPSLLNAGRIAGGEVVDNGAALAIAGLGDLGLTALGGASIRESWLEATQSIGIRAGAAKTRSEAADLVRENLEAQRASVSGVSIDEESINMLNSQRQYQGAARFITVIDELTQTLLSMI